MRERPSDLADSEVLDLVVASWGGAVDRVTHLPVGFGAHHWRAEAAGRPVWFVTYDRFGSRHTPDSLTAAYEGAIALAAQGLEFVLAPTPTDAGDVLVPVGGGVGRGALSCTRWVDGTVVGEGALTDPAVADQNIADLARLHSVPAPTGIPPWRPLVSASLGTQLAELVAAPWRSGPYGEPTRTAIVDRLGSIEGWLVRYLELAEAAPAVRWVATHGETHTANQLRTADGILFVDWESVKLAPRERDLSTLVQAGYGDRLGADPDLVELFDLEWRICEIDEYAHRFADAHTGSADDTIAYGGLVTELGRGPWWPTG